MEYYRFFLYVLFGILPSLVWLFYYLHKDLHPEPRKMILRVFVLGCLVTIPVFLLQVVLSDFASKLQHISFFVNHPITIELVKWFLVIAFTEEFLKFLVVRTSVFGSYVIDEPLDIMLYMVVVSLGFAAVENILYLFSPIDGVSFNVIIQTTLAISFVRFIGATLLHTLSSALLGYFMALASLRGKKGFSLTIIGLMLATSLHGLYDFSIIALSSPLNFYLPVGIVLGLVVFMIYDFDEVKKIKSICKL